MSKQLRLHLLIGLFMAACLPWVSAQHSVARQWNEVLLQDIREDFARPPVHARNLFHTAIAMYDAWAAYDTTADTYLLGKTVGNYTCAFEGVTAPADLQAAEEKAISYAAYRVLLSRFNFFAANPAAAYTRATNLMIALGYDINITSIDYANGGPAELGNYIAQSVILMGYADGSNELGNYAYQSYAPVNPPLPMFNPGNPTMVDPNHWQPLQLLTAIDQNGNPIPATQKFQSPEWGSVTPFALTSADLTVHTRNGHDYPVYHDPGPFPALDTATGGGLSAEYKWNFSLVSVWAAQNTPDDTVVWDISPRSIGNNQSYPHSLAELHTFYNLEGGGDNSPGRPTNPATGQPYAPQYVQRGDYTRVLAQFWADGPNSETPPGHWFSILNKVNDDPNLVKKFNGKGPVLSDLEWDVKGYFMLGGAVHDAAVTCWGIKGWYDGVRPVSALRYMAGKGQSTDSLLPHYSPAGIPLKPGYIELVQAGDPLAGASNENVGKIKFFTWKGPQYITNPSTDFAGAGWILAENWWPYQRATFVTPPFAGYTSGHSTYSRASAEVLTALTGNEYFPGGMGEYHIAANSGFLGLEKGPSQDVTLQWATYRDASDQCSLSRIWGGIHPPMDDIPARLMGIEIGQGSYAKAKTYFYQDADGDGHYTYEDCDDHNADIYDGAPELCDGVDNNCNGLVDDGLPVFTFYVDGDGDGFGSSVATAVENCQNTAPAGYVANNQDCNDQDPDINPATAEICDREDNNCDGLIDEGLPTANYYEDADHDGFGSVTGTPSLSCPEAVPTGYVENNLDCDDQNVAISPAVAESCDSIDNNCNGLVDDGIVFYTYYLDADGDGFGESNALISTCANAAPVGFADNELDCNDADAAIHPGVEDICDEVDNNCDGSIDEGLVTYSYYVDGDGDGYGTPDLPTYITCITPTPIGSATNNLDCNDDNPNIYPGAIEVIDGLDNDCDGVIDSIVGTTEPFGQIRVYPNPVKNTLFLYDDTDAQLEVSILNAFGQVVRIAQLPLNQHAATLDFSDLQSGIYFLVFANPSERGAATTMLKIVKME